MTLVKRELHHSCHLFVMPSTRTYPGIDFDCDELLSAVIDCYMNVINET